MVQNVLNTGDLKGHGYLHAGGGAAVGSGSGGAGGQIAVHSSIRNEFRGIWLAVGGVPSGSGDVGGPGTVFIEDMLVRDLLWKSRLYVNGDHLDPPKPVVLNERNPRMVERGLVHRNLADIGFDELMLEKKVS